MAATTSMTKIDLTKANDVAEVTTTAIVAAAAKLAIPMAGAKFAVLHVKNADAAATAYVTIAAGDGIRKSLGDRIVTVAIGKEKKIRIWDTARHLIMSGDDKGNIVVEFNDASGVALASGVLEDLTVWAELL